MKANRIRIGGATGFWGEADLGLPQFLADGDVDYVVFDYLAEITLSIMARARAADASKGYATDWVDVVMVPNLSELARQGIKVISNAGGINPEQCAERLRAAIAEAGLTLKVAVVVGDDVTGHLPLLEQQGVRDMFSGEALPELESIASANAYLGAFPIAAALSDGADIVITGRCVDSAVTLGACIHAFDWRSDQLDLLATGSLAGHLIECGPQVSGGNYTDWESVADLLHRIGYPIAEVGQDGSVVITKARDTGGIVTEGTVGEQLLYEIGDPAHYALPDVVCDFTQVKLAQLAPDRVEVTGAIGRGIPEHYKVSLTWFDGWRAGTVMFYAGRRAADKARIFAEQGLKRARQKLIDRDLEDYREVEIDVIGVESHWGAAARYVRSREVAVKVACHHSNKAACEWLMRDLTGMVLAAPAGLFSFAGTRPKPSPVVRLFSLLIPKDALTVRVINDGKEIAWQPAPPTPLSPTPIIGEPPLPSEDLDESMTSVPLEQLAFARSGDKGDKANIGVMARDPAFLPWIARTLTAQAVAERFKHLMTSDDYDRYYLPGIHGFNFVLHNALGGGGVASLRSDPQAKCFAQLLLDFPIEIPSHLVDQHHASHC